MLSRVIHDLYHLKRIHSIVLDEKLGHALKAKLTTLDLRAGPSPGPSALRRLLECLVYFQLEQSPVTASAVALVREELPQMTGSQLSRTIAACCTLGQHDVSVSAVPLLAEALPSIDSAGTVELIQSLADAGVRHEDTWSLLADHCIRRMDTFTGRQLYCIIECFYERKVHYPDFYKMAERHICAQPSSYISMEHLGGVIECYRGLGMPVVSLLAASSTRSAEGFDSGLIAVAPARTRRGHRGDVSVFSSAGEGTSNHTVIAAFVQSTLKAISTADDSQLTDMLQKCEAKQVMHPEIMEAAALRLQQLHTDTPDVARTTAIMRLMMRFDKKEWFITASRPLSEVLDECGESAIPLLAHRMLSIASATLKLFPPEIQPTKFYTALVRDLKFDDVAASTDTKRLPLLTGVMVSLHTYGGHALLEQHMSVIAMATANAPFRVQVELAAMLAPLPAAQKVFLPDLFNSLSSQKNWVRTLTARETILLLDALARSRLRFNDLLLAIVEYTRKNLSRFEASELVNTLLQCAMLRFNDIEFYSSTATHILEKAPKSTVHDLCLLLYVFTFVLKGVIRVVQQMLPRLRVSAGHTTPRDITLVLYSTVKLSINRHAELTTLFCDRAVNVFTSFKGEELASCMGSLRALNFDHEGFLSATAQVLGIALTRREGTATKTTTTHNDNEIKLTDTQIISIASTIVQLRPSLLQSEWQMSLQRICFTSLESAGASQTHLIAITLAALDKMPCTLEQQQLLLRRANVVCERFQGGTLAAEVLLALHDLMIRNGSDEVRETLAPSPLLACAQSNMSSIMSNTELRDRLRSKGLLGLLSGVGSSIGADEDERISLHEIPLRDSLLMHHKSMRRPATHTRRGRNNTSRALKPTSITTTATSTAAGTTTKTKTVGDTTKTEKKSRSRRSSSEKHGKMSVAATAAANTRKGSSVNTTSIDFGVESQGDVEEFRI
ncbi:uncharacterized protein TM35_000222290 [Trypanosoma theileri]|uniref:RNA-editing substrate-binding complex 6 protein domain-containing protein n=1 Tax=Trypanosoma theileri TaxID=67003 RepID=A0A1X0NTJ4_9TRYP|nr:uncharacterized protein TM35_000222290 [Trypanosoma theileri]ORC87430.1 hypothetical protein TM35_000222290 [Trypanosoma theileri]